MKFSLTMDKTLTSSWRCWSGGNQHSILKWLVTWKMIAEKNDHNFNDKDAHGDGCFVISSLIMIRMIIDAIRAVRVFANAGVKYLASFFSFCRFIITANGHHCKGMVSTSEELHWQVHEIWESGFYHFKELIININFDWIMYYRITCNCASNRLLATEQPNK